MDWKSATYVTSTALAGVVPLVPAPYNVAVGIFAAFLAGLATTHPADAKTAQAQAPVASNAAIENLKAQIAAQLQTQLNKLKETPKS